MIDAEGLARLQARAYARAGSSLVASWPSTSGMDAQELRAFLGERSYCALATSTARGRPQVRPVAFLVQGTSFWFATVAGPRLRHLQLMPWASAVIEEGDRGQHRAVAVDGPVELIERPPRETLEAWRERHGSEAEWAAAWFELRPQRLLSYTARRPPR